MTDTDEYEMGEVLPPPTAQHAREQVHPLRMAVDALDLNAPTLAERLSTEDLTLFLGLIQTYQARLADVAAYVAMVAGDRLGKQDTRWDNGMRAERTRAWRTEWKPETANVVLDDLLDHPDPQYAVAARDTLSRLQELARLEWRSGEVAKYADVDELRHREQTHYRVKVTLPAGVA